MATKTYYTTNTGTWRDMYPRWRENNDQCVRQGGGTDYGLMHGVALFNMATIRSDLSGQIVDKIEIYFHRNGVSLGSNVQKKLRIYGVTAATIVINGGSAPSWGTNYGDYDIGAFNTGTWITLPNTAATAIINSQVVGFGTHYTSNNTTTYYTEQYGILGTDTQKPKLRITYHTANTAPYWPSGASMSASPTGIVSSGTSTTTLSWSAGADAEGGTLEYFVQRSRAGGAWTAVWNGTARSVSVSLGSAGQADSYRVQIKDNGGLYSGWLTGPTITRNQVPTVPGSVSCNRTGTVASTTTSATITWTASSVGGGNQTLRYEVQRSVNGAAYTSIASNLTALKHTDSFGSSYTGSTIQYRVRAYDGFPEYSAFATAAQFRKNAIPVAPTVATIRQTNSSGTEIGSGATIPENISVIYIYWGGATDADGHSMTYNVYRIKDGVSTLIKSNVNAGNTTDTIGAGNQGSSYYYRIYAHDGHESSSGYRQTNTFYVNQLNRATIISATALTHLTSSTTLTISAGSNTNGTAVSYKIDSPDVVISGKDRTFTGNLTLNIGTHASLPYITKANLLNAYRNKDFKGNISFVLTTTNSYGSSSTHNYTGSVNLQEPLTGLGLPSFSGGINVSGTTIYVPDRNDMGIEWSAASLSYLNGEEIKYDLDISYNSGSTYTSVMANWVQNFYTFNWRMSAAQTNVYFRVTAKTNYGATLQTVNPVGARLDYWDPPSVSLRLGTRTETGMTFTITVVPDNTSYATLANKAASNPYYYKLDNGAKVYSTNAPTTVSGLTDNSSYRLEVGYRSVGLTTANLGSGEHVFTWQTIPVYLPMLSVRQFGVGIGVVPENNEYILRVSGNTLVGGNLTLSSGKNLTVPGTITEGGTLLSSKYAPFSHTHNYLPLTGGTLSGGLTLHGGGNVPVVSSVYHASSGVLVDICPDNTSNMITVEVVGNGYSTQHPIRSIFQTYHYTPYGTFIQSKQTNVSGNLSAGKFMIHNGRVKLWFPQSGPYQTFIVNAYGMSGVIYKTNISNLSEPTSSYKSTCSLKTILDSGNWSSYAAPASHTHSYLPLTGGTMTGILYPQRNTSYTTGQARRIILSTGNPSGGGNGDVWIKYT